MNYQGGVFVVFCILVCFASYQTGYFRPVWIDGEDSFRRKISTWSSVPRLSMGTTLHQTDLLPILMNKADLRLFLHFVKKADFYFEWGSGGSTQIVPFLVQHAASVDMHPDWCKKMTRDNPWVSNAVALGALTYYCVDIEGKPLGAWGVPKNESDRQFIGQRYVQSIDIVSPKVPKFPGYFDVIFVDGRFRVACTLYSVSKMYARPGRTFLIIDDYGVRDYYKVVETYLDLVSGGTKTETTSVFTVKESVDRKSLERDVEKYLNDYR